MRGKAMFLYILIEVMYVAVAGINVGDEKPTQ
jgi:hypothetical protein